MNTMKKMESKELSIKQNMMYNTFGSVVLLVCQWLTTVLVVRLSTYENAGMLSLAMSVTNIFFGFASFGMRTFQVSDIQNVYADSIYVTSRILTCLVSQLLCMIFVLCNSRYTSSQMICVIIYMIYRVIEAFVDVLYGIEQKKMRMDYIGISSVARGIFTLIGFVVSMILTKNLNIAILSMVLISATIVLFYDIPRSSRLRKYQICFSRNEIMRLLKECFPLMINTVLLISMISIPRYFLEMYDGERLLGIYSSIATPTVIVQTACIWIYTPLVSEFSTNYIYQNKKKYMNLLMKTIAVLSGVFLFLIIGAFIFGDFGLKILFGSEILQYSGMLIQIMFVTMLMSIVHFLNMLLTICRKQTQVALVNGVTLLGIIFLSYNLIPSYHISGVNYTLFIALAIDCISLGIILAQCVRKNFGGAN